MCNRWLDMCLAVLSDAVRTAMALLLSAVARWLVHDVVVVLDIVEDLLDGTDSEHDPTADDGPTELDSSTS